MPKFVFTYRQPNDHVVSPEATGAWTAFFQRLAPHVVDPGQPVVERTAVGENGPSTRLAGYSVIEAETVEAALDLARACPAMGNGGGVEVGRLGELPDNHPAAVLRRARASVQ